MIAIFSANSLVFLADLAKWLFTPVPLTFFVLFLFVGVCRFLREVMHV